jgi:flagellar hook-basal body complex protein FliE
MNAIGSAASALTGLQSVLGADPRAAVARAGAGGDFGDVLARALEATDSGQRQASELSNKFQLGDPAVSLEETMIAMQKANLSFQTLVQVRNRFVSAYHDIMNMQV